MSKIENMECPVCGYIMLECQCPDYDLGYDIDAAMSGMLEEASQHFASVQHEKGNER